MKKLLFIAAFVCLVMSSCTKFTPTGIAGTWYIHKNGKVGVVRDRDIKMYVNQGNSSYSYGRLTIDKELLKEPYLSSLSGLIPWHFDEITVEKFNNGKAALFRCTKDNKAYYYNTTLTKKFAGGNPVNKIESLGMLYLGSACKPNDNEYRFYTDKGIYTRNIGPYEDIYIGIYGYAFKQNGKWGWFYGRDDSNKGKYTQILKPEYDAVIEVHDGGLPQKFPSHSNLLVVLGRKGKTWYAYDSEGKPLKVNQDFVETLFNIPAEDERTINTIYMPFGVYRKRCGNRTTGIVVIDR